MSRSGVFGSSHFERRSTGIHIAQNLGKQDRSQILRYNHKDDTDFEQCAEGERGWWRSSRLARMTNMSNNRRFDYLATSAFAGRLHQGSRGDSKGKSTTSARAARSIPLVIVTVDGRHDA